MKNGQKTKIGDAQNPKKYPRSTSLKAWGCPRGTPFFIGKNQVTFQDTIFLLLYALCVFLGASIVFAFSFPFVLFAAINGLITSYYFGGDELAFYLPRTL
jgi:hypothetical protein